MRTKPPNYPKRKPLVAIRLHPKSERIIGISRGAAWMFVAVYFSLLLAVTFAVGDDVPGPPVPTGSCCLGNGQCEEEWTELECKTAGGLWQREKDCEPMNVNPCKLPGGYDR